METIKISFFWLSLLFIFSSCTSIRTAKLIKEMQNLQPSDFAFIVQPEFKTSKENVENKIQELFFAEEVKIGAAGIGGVVGSPTQHEDDKYWLECVILNSWAISDIQYDPIIIKNGKEIASLVLDGISNVDQYDKILIRFVLQYKDGQYWKTIKNGKCFTVPELKITEL